MSLCWSILFIITLFPDCPEDVTLGVVWKRSLTNTTHKHQCSSIHPSFKLSDMLTRECMKNRSWGQVDMSQCVMDIDSPVLMILVITLNTENSTLVQAEMDQIHEEVDTVYYLLINNGNFFVNFRGQRDNLSLWLLKLTKKIFRYTRTPL